MKLSGNSADRRLFLFLAALTAASLAVMAILCAASAARANRAMLDAYAGITATVCEKYPQSEQQVVRDITGYSAPDTAKGYRILSKYGIEQTDLSGNAAASSLLRMILPAGFAFTIILCGLFFLAAVLYRRSVSAELRRLTDYLRRVSSGDYSLDIRDNGEGAFSILKNEICKITVMLREQADNLKKDKINLSNSVSDISHQLKTPLTSLFVLADLIAEKPPEDAMLEFVERLKAQLGRMQWLVSSLLKLARLDSGTADLRCEKVNISRLVEKALEPLRIPAELKNQRLTVSGDAEASFSGDFNWSAEALTNIIKNCVEHTGDGGEIHIEFYENMLYSQISISDNGEGIAAEDLPHIFTRFYRGKNAGENSVGIGLAMARAIVEAQCGELTAQSKPGRGTRFEMRLYRCVV